MKTGSTGKTIGSQVVVDLIKKTFQVTRIALIRAITDSIGGADFLPGSDVNRSN